MRYEAIGVLLLLCGMQSIYAKTITLTNDNFVVLRGPITPASSANFMVHMMEQRDILVKNNQTELYVYLLTNGGSITHGLEIINLMRSFEQEGLNVSCVTAVGLSMGFIITQACSTRYVLPSSVLMQHQAAFGLQGSTRHVETYYKFVLDTLEVLEHEQADRIGISHEDFMRKTHDDWWIFGKNNIAENTADELVTVVCDFPTQVVGVPVQTFFGQVMINFNKCPLITTPVGFNFDDIDENMRNDIRKIIESDFTNITQLANSDATIYN